MVQGVRGQGGSRGKSGTQRLLASAPFVRCQFSICHDNIGKILRVALSQLDKRGISEGAGKLHEHYFVLSASSQQLMTDSAAAAAIVLT